MLYCFVPLATWRGFLYIADDLLNAGGGKNVG